jgi:hypothetical protein
LKEALVPFQDPPQSKEQYSGLEESELLDDFFAVDAFTRCVLTS